MGGVQRAADDGHDAGSGRVSDVTGGRLGVQAELGLPLQIVSSFRAAYIYWQPCKTHINWHNCVSARTLLK